MNEYKRSADDEFWMRRAVELAALGRGRVEPNPPVGAVIVRDGRAAGEGFHERFGGPHAEVRAMDAAGGCAGAALYVTLAPCTGGRKKTPPCCEAVARAGFSRVVIGTEDPTQDSCVPRLTQGGTEVRVGALQEECRALIRPFLTLHLLGRPFVIAKWAMTADGKMASATGDSRWITGEASRARVHRWRGEVEGVIIGAGTALRDDPLLTCRPPDLRGPRGAGEREEGEASARPLRIVLDAEARLPLSSRLVQSARETPVMVACLDSADLAACARLERAGCRVMRLPGRDGLIDIETLLKRLGDEGLTNVMVEGGPEALSSFFHRGLIDEARIFVAPKLIAGAEAPSPLPGEGLPRMADALRLQQAAWEKVGEDALLTGFFPAPAAIREAFERVSRT